MSMFSKISAGFLALALVVGGLALPVSATTIPSLVPTINAPVNGSNVTIYSPVVFNGSATGGTAPYAYVWNFGDSTSAFGESFSKIYSVIGPKTVQLVVTDFTGLRATTTINLTVVDGNQDNTPPSTPTITTSTHQPNIPSATTTVTVAWTPSTDNMGLAGYSFLWDNNANTIPDNTVDSTTTSLTQTLTPGTWYFHIKAIDTAGNSSATTHYGPIVITDPGNNDPLTITNIQVTDITQTGATIRWTTNRPANSRVIYDTVSHPDISGQTGPNYGYANSTATFDDNPKVTSHVVAVTGLAANTSYYFRVISQE